jgi:hypothetical protein
MDLAGSTDEFIKLTGPTAGSRMVGGATAAFGGVFATVGAGFMRLPIPLPFKLIPLAFTAIGTGIAAVGTSAALSACSVEVKKGQGITASWKLPLRDERSFHIPLDKLEAFEVTDHAHEQRDDYGSRIVMEYRLVAVTRSGNAIGLESFGTRTQARLRKEAFEKVLGRV